MRPFFASWIEIAPVAMMTFRVRCLRISASSLLLRSREMRIVPIVPVEILIAADIFT